MIKMLNSVTLVYEYKQKYFNGILIFFCHLDVIMSSVHGGFKILMTCDMTYVCLPAMSNVTFEDAFDIFEDTMIYNSTTLPLTFSF